VTHGCDRCSPPDRRGSCGLGLQRLGGAALKLAAGDHTIAFPDNRHTGPLVMNSTKPAKNAARCAPVNAFQPAHGWHQLLEAHQLESPCARSGRGSRHQPRWTPSGLMAGRCVRGHGKSVGVSPHRLRPGAPLQRAQLPQSLSLRGANPDPWGDRDGGGWPVEPCHTKFCDRLISLGSPARPRARWCLRFRSPFRVRLVRRRRRGSLWRRRLGRSYFSVTSAAM